MNGMRASEGSWGRPALALALTYLLLLKAIFLPFPSIAMPDGPGLFGTWVICSQDKGGAAISSDDNGDPASHHESCCDAGCLMRTGGLLPLILGALPILFSRLPSRAPRARAPARTASGPPARIAARPQAPRAPPRLRFV
jgi:hypothetical protein